MWEFVIVLLAGKVNIAKSMLAWPHVGCMVSVMHPRYVSAKMAIQEQLA